MKIVIQGALESELAWYLEQPEFAGCEKKTVHGFDFYEACRAGHELILELTGMGTVAAAAATMAAVCGYCPDAVINQGTAGAHVKELKSGDIIIGKQVVNIHSLEMPKREFGAGMRPEEWKGMHTDYLEADAGLLRYFEEKFSGKGDSSMVITGILGTGDLFSREKDRIEWLHQIFGNLSEDMESYAVYYVCRKCGVPAIALRVISNNELLDEAYDPDTARRLQQYIWEALGTLG